MAGRGEKMFREVLIMECENLPDCPILQKMIWTLETKTLFAGGRSYSRQLFYATSL